MSCIIHWAFARTEKPGFRVFSCRRSLRPASPLGLRRATFAVEAGLPTEAPKAPKVGAGERNRTVVISLEGCCSTIELHPRKLPHRWRKFAPLRGRTGLKDGPIVPQPDGRPCYRSRPGCASTLTEKQPLALTCTLLCTLT